MRRFTGPFALAIIVTLANAAKPVVVDDTAYLAYARHIAQHPLDPYGFTIHWYTFPEPAMNVLAPPVLPYWLALGIRLFGEHIFLLKLWLFPFLLCFTYSLDVLLKRFARGTERFALPLIVLSPAVLPTVNLMLDIPAAALGLAALAMFMAACDRDDWKRAMLAGLIAGLAMQTKYTAMLVPAAIVWYGLTHRHLLPAIVACSVAVLTFASWEYWLHAQYGQSHFLHHLAEQRASSENWLQEKSGLIPGLVGHLGLLGFGIALFVARPLGLPNGRLRPIARVWLLGLVVVSILSDYDFRARNYWRPFGTAVLLTALLVAGKLALKKRSVRFSRGSWFVAGWLLLELAGYFVLTPFPAGRRVIGFTIVFGIIAARLVSRIRRIRPERIPPRWVLRYAIATSGLFMTLDTIDAYSDKVVAERAAENLPSENRIWFAGHWGFQYYCEHAGFTMIVPGETVLQPGDIVLLPQNVDRPHVGLVRIRPPKVSARQIGQYYYVSGPAAQTIPNFYGGNEPVLGEMDMPHLYVRVYRFTKPWPVPGR